uniref:Ribonuclease H-like domain-containing protein n=1 Tax=Tanacetum cinerariifolium TaxID=118510 RepID=A0A6L2KI04_TANCI|nr:ribonuclease H-like domain-containing protein [Tanacetum cinerariifolium]
MDSLSTQVVSTAKLPILNPNEFDLWKMRIEQYFLMTDYSLWEVILNGDSYVPTIVVEGVVQPVGYTSAKQKLAKMNELKARGKTTQNLAFVSSSNTDSTTDSVSVAASVSTVCAKLHVSSLPNVDSLNNAIDVDDLEEIDLRWHMAMFTMRARRSPKDSRRNGVAEPQRRTVPVKTSTSNALVSQCDGIRSYDWSYQVEEEPANFALMAFSPSRSSSDNETNKKHGLGYFSSKSDSESCSPSSFSDRSQTSGGYHVVPPPITGTFMPPKPDLVFHTASIAFETDHSAFTDWVSDSEDESETIASQIVPSFVQSYEQVKTPRHSVQPVKTSIPAATPKPTSPKSISSRKRRNRKTFFVCKSVDHLIKNCDYHTKKMAQPTPRNYAHRVLTESKLVSITAVRQVSAAMPKIIVNRPRLAHPIVTKVTAVQAPVGNPQYALKDKGVIDSGCSRHMTGNMSYLSKFEELNGGYVAFGGNPKGGKISGKGKIKTGKLDFKDVYFVKELKFNIFSVSQMCDKKNNVLFTNTKCLVLSPDFKLPDESQVMLRVLKENKMYNVNLKNIVPFGDLTCLFEKATLDESNLWHRRNKDGDASFDGKEHEVDTNNPESAVNVSPTNLSTKFKDYSDNSSNDVNAVGSIVPTAGQNSSNSTKLISAAGPSNATASLTHGKSSFKDASQLPKNPDIEDITYADHDNVGAEADFNNLETSITVSPIPTTRTHKDHPVSQIIGVNTPRSDEDRLELMGLTIFLLPKIEWIEIGVNAVSLKVSAVRHEGSQLPTKRRDFYWIGSDALRLADAGGVNCLPNEEIFTGLARMGYEKPSTKLTFYKAFFSSQWKFLIHTILQSMSAKRTSWNEFSSAMASAIICLSIGRKFNFSKYIFKSLVRNVDSSSKFYMYLRSIYSITYSTHSTTKTTSRYSIHITSTIPSTTTQSPTPDQPQGVDFPISLLQEALDACAALTKRVKNLEHDKVAQDLEIIKLKGKAKKLERVNKVKALKLRRLRKVGTSQRVDTSADTIMKDVSNQGRMIDELDKDKGATLMSEKEEEKKAEKVKDITGDAQVEGRQAEIYQIDMDHAAKVSSMQEDEPEVEAVSAASANIAAAVVPAATITVARVKVTAASTRRRRGVVIRDPEEESTAEIPNETKLDYFKGMSYDDIPQFNTNIKFLLKSKEEIEEEENRALESIHETLAQKAAKRRRLNEKSKDVEDLKQHLEIVPDEDDDAYTEATSLARKVPVVDYQIIQLNNKPRSKIIRADGTHQLYVSFITLLKNFDKEDLESLWSIVKERFSTSKPNNYSNDYLLTTLRAMFGRPDGQDQVWKSQRSVHGQAKLILLVERRYPLSRFTLDQMLNAVRLQVEEQSEMSLELIRLRLFLATSTWFSPPPPASGVSFHLAKTDLSIHATTAALAVAGRCAYAPQVGLSEVEKKTFWDSLDKVVREFLTDQQLILGGDLNAHIGMATKGYAGFHGGFRRKGSALLRILWKNLTGDATEAFRFRVALDAVKDTIWVSIGTSKTHTARRDSWWLCKEVQAIVAVKQARFRELLSCREVKQHNDTLEDAAEYVSVDAAIKLTVVRGVSMGGAARLRNRSE